MQLALHAGAHFTEDERLLKCLLRNKPELAPRGTSVPGPSKYRRLLRDTINAMDYGGAASGARDVILDALLDDETAERIILSNAHFFGPARAAMRDGLLYPKAVIKLQRLTQIFAGDHIELFMGLRNPATFIPAIAQMAPDMDLATFLGPTVLADVKWSELILRIRQDLPDVAITVWCNEDAPLIWAQIIREIAGYEHTEKVVGGFDLLSSIMSAEGMQRFRSYLSQHAGMNEIQKRRVIGAFLEKFALDDEIEEELDLPGWNEPLVDDLTAIYDDDIDLVRTIPGVNFISP